MDPRPPGWARVKVRVRGQDWGRSAVGKKRKRKEKVFIAKVNGCVWGLSGGG